jgi:hypothetical protein
VTFLDAEDGNSGCVQALIDAGYHAIKGDVRDYVPQEEHDLLILQNPAVPARWSTPHLKRGGYIICNNYHGTGQELAQTSEEFKLLAGLNVKNGVVKLDTGLEGYFEPVANAEEYRKLRPEGYAFDMGHVDHWISQGIIDCKPTDSLDAKLIALVKGMGLSMPAKKVADQYLFQKR